MPTINKAISRPAVRYAAQVPCYDVSTMMARQAAVTSKIGFEVPGIQGLVDMYAESSSTTKKTLADIARAHAHGVSVPQIVGNPEQIADWMQDAMATVGGDGFLLSPAYVPGAIEEFVDMVVPELQRRGLVRDEYVEGGLRDNLLAF